MEERFLGKAVVVTGMGCNSNCTFCLQDTRDPSFYPKGDVLKEIADGKLRGADWLILSGGESSIHKNFIDFVSFAKGLGYKRIQTISNGRMFASRKFTRKAAAAGLTEATISFHGASREKHDALTRTPGSFREASIGALNCRDSGILLSFNTALNSLNVLDSVGILKHIREKMGFKNFDYDIVGTAPSGLAWKHKLLPKHEDVKEGLRQALEYAEEHGIVVWVTRTPIQDFPRGYEHHKEPWESITHEVLGMWDFVWKAEKSCPAPKCEYCESAPYCDHIKSMLQAMDGGLDYVTGQPVPGKLDKASKLSGTFLLTNPGDAQAVKGKFKPFFRMVFDGLNHGIDRAISGMQAAEDAGIESELEFHVNRRSLESIEELREFKPVFSPTNPYPYVKYIFDRGNRLHDTTGALMKLGEMEMNGDWKDVPLCIHRGKDKEYWLNLDDFSNSLEVIPRKLVNRLATDLRVYKWECDSCALREKCPGFFGDYVKLFGFDDVRAFSRPAARQSR